MINLLIILVIVSVLSFFMGIFVGVRFTKKVESVTNRVGKMIKYEIGIG